MNDRRRVELTLLSQMLLGAIQGAIDVETDADAKACVTRLQLVTLEILKDQLPPARAKIMRRSHRAYDDVFTPLVRGKDANPQKIALAAFYVLQNVVATGYVVVGEESILQSALDVMLPALEPAAAIPLVNSSALRQADRILAGYRQLGYFPATY